MLRFGWRNLAIHIKPFGAQKPYAVGEKTHHGLRVFARVQIDRHVHLMPVARYRRQAAHGVQKPLFLTQLALELLIFFQRLGTGGNYHYPLIAVENHHIAGFYLPGDIGQADHRGQFHALRQKRGVAGLAAHIGAKAKHLCLAQMQRF